MECLVSSSIEYQLFKPLMLPYLALISSEAAAFDNNIDDSAVQLHPAGGSDSHEVGRRRNL